MSPKVVPTTITTPPRDSDACTRERMSPRSPERLFSSAEGSTGLPSLPRSPLASWRADEVLSEPDAADASASKTGLGLGLPTSSDEGAGVSLSSLASTATPLERYQREAGHSTRAGPGGGGHCIVSSPPKVVALVPGRDHLRLPPVGGAGNSVLKPSTIVSAPGLSSSEQPAAAVVASSSGGKEKLSHAALLKASGASARGKACEVADAKGKGGGGPEGRDQGNHLKLHTVSMLPGLARPHVTSYAEEHNQDISAEINSLSTVR